jgi:hypothetical protein
MKILRVKAPLAQNIYILFSILGPRLLLALDKGHQDEVGQVAPAATGGHKQQFQTAA